MLDELCAELRNYFIGGVNNIHNGTFTISEGSLEPLSFLQNDQYFRIVGSVFNDGVYQYNSSAELKDETFTGSIWAMAVPPAVIALSNEIDDWVQANADALTSPYQSESFGGYSYSKSSGSHNAGESGGAYGWQDQFTTKLARWRRLSVL